MPNITLDDNTTAIYRGRVLSWIARNSIGGWTIRYPVHNDEDASARVWFAEKHFDADQKEMAWSLAMEKEQEYWSVFDDMLEQTG